MTITRSFRFDGLAILLVEDDPTSLMFMSHVLTKCGAIVESASHGSEALEKFGQQHFHVIVTDINMPIMDGLELARRIRQHNTDIQIIATSANRDTECLISAMECGFNDYILKPIEMEKLLWSVKRSSDSIAERLKLKDEQQKFRAVVDCMGEGLCIKDLDYRILYQNPAMTKMIGEHTGSYCFRMFGFDEPCGGCPTALALQDGLTHTANRPHQRNGATIYIESTSSLLKNSQGAITGSVEILRDVSERITTEQAIRNLAFHDPLTGLPNRRLFDDRLEQAIAKSHRYRMKFGLLYLDLDHFKQVNDMLGHEAGDLVLVEAGERIRSCCKRDLDTICRQGGDEFCVIITDCGGRQQLEEIAEKLLNEFRYPFKVNGTEVTVTASIGIGLFPADGTDPRGLQFVSDTAMYAAKQAGRNTFCCAASTEEKHTTDYDYPQLPIVANP